MYPIVPTTPVVKVWSSLSARAIPKSQRYACSSPRESLTRTLLGFPVTVDQARRVCISQAVRDLGSQVQSHYEGNGTRCSQSFLQVRATDQLGGNEELAVLLTGVKDLNDVSRIE